MAVQVASNAPARSLPISTLASVTIENMVLPLAHGRAATASGAHACFVIMPRPVGSPLSHQLAGPPVAWSEQDLLNFALRPIASALDQLHKTGMTHRAIRPNNVFRARAGLPLVLGGAWAAPAASAQDCVFEPPYSALCHPAGRGDGSIADDVYALGVLLVLLATGVTPMAGSDDEEIIRCKLERGSFSALTGHLHLPSTISDLLRGMLAEDPEHRPPPTLLADPFTARSRRSATHARARAQRPLNLGGTAVWDARTLANAMHHAPNIAVRQLRTPDIDIWLRRTLGEPVLAARLDEIIRGRQDDPIGERANSDPLMLMRVIAVLDPLAPLSWQGLALFPDGLGSLLAVSAEPAGGAVQEKIETIIETEACAIWGEARPARSDLAMLRLDCRQQRILLRTGGWAGGLSRLAYALNSLLPCRSPLIGHEAVLRVSGLMPAFERKAASRAHPQSDFIIDRESAAFIAARFNGRMDSDFGILAQHEDPDIDPPGQRGLAQLQVLSRISSLDSEPRWPAVAALVVRPARAALSKWRSRTSRSDRENALNAAVEAGSILGMLAVLLDDLAVANDAQASQAALSELQKVESEMTMLVNTRQSRWARARNTGHEIAAGLGMIALAGAAVFKVLP